jgi:hypothetical protein
MSLIPTFFTEIGNFPSKVTFFSQKEHGNKEFVFLPHRDNAQKDAENPVGICQRKSQENQDALLHFQQFCGILIAS